VKPTGRSNRSGQSGGGTNRYKMVTKRLQSRQASERAEARLYSPSGSPWWTLFQLSCWPPRLRSVRPSTNSPRRESSALGQAGPMLGTRDLPRFPFSGMVQASPVELTVFSDYV